MPTMPVSKSSKPTQPPPSLQAVRRAVASSTAVETGQSVAALESKLSKPARRFPHITLAR